jgi:hypothetical protein
MFIKRLILIELLFLAGCAVPYGGTYKFSGPGTFQDFAGAVSRCYRETQAIAGIHNMPQCGAVMACMAGRGYIQDKNGNHDVESISFRCSP